MATPPVLIPVDVTAIQNELQTSYETASGKTLQPAHPETLILNAMAYREVLIRSTFQNAAVQMMVDFASAPILDYLGQLVGVSRTQAQPSKAQVAMYTNGVGVETIPEGTRFATSDGQVVFVSLVDAPVTLDPAIAPAPNCIVEVESEEGGLNSNLPINTNLVLLDSLANPYTCKLYTAATGGAEIESDELLRERIKIAPDSFSVAGSIGSYKYFTKASRPDIVDVYVQSTAPGVVDVYPLILDSTNGNLPLDLTYETEIIDQITESLSEDKVRPICDTVEVHPPGIVSVGVAINFSLYDGYDSDTVRNKVIAAVYALQADRAKRLGADLLTNHVVRAVMDVEGVYNCNVVFNVSGIDQEPGYDVIVGKTDVCSLSPITVVSDGIGGT